MRLPCRKLQLDATKGLSCSIALKSETEARIGGGKVRRTSNAILTGLLAMGFSLPAFLYGQLPEPGSAASSVPNPLSDTTVQAGHDDPLRPRSALCQRRSGARRGGFCRLVCRGWRRAGQRRRSADRKVAVVKNASWAAKDYQLVWTPTDAVMGPSATWATPGVTLKDTARTPTEIR